MDEGSIKTMSHSSIPKSSGPKCRFILHGSYRPERRKPHASLSNRPIARANGSAPIPNDTLPSADPDKLLVSSSLSTNNIQPPLEQSPVDHVHVLPSSSPASMISDDSPSSAPEAEPRTPPQSASEVGMAQPDSSKPPDQAVPDEQLARTESSQTLPNDEGAISAIVKEVHVPSSVQVRSQDPSAECEHRPEAMFGLPSAPDESSISEQQPLAPIDVESASPVHEPTNRSDRTPEAIHSPNSAISSPRLGTSAPEHSVDTPGLDTAHFVPAPICAEDAVNALAPSDFANATTKAACFAPPEHADLPIPSGDGSTVGASDDPSGNDSSRPSHQADTDDPSGTPAEEEASDPADGHKAACWDYQSGAPADEADMGVLSGTPAEVEASDAADGQEAMYWDDRAGAPADEVDIGDLSGTPAEEEVYDAVDGHDAAYWDDSSGAPAKEESSNAVDGHEVTFWDDSSGAPADAEASEVVDVDEATHWNCEPQFDPHAWTEDGAPYTEEQHDQWGDYNGTGWNVEPQPYNTGDQDPPHHTYDAGDGEVCQYFLQGKCLFGAKCRNLHTEPSNSGPAAAPCIYFARGFCQRGDSCRYSHGVNKLYFEPPVHQGSVLAPRQARQDTDAEHDMPATVASTARRRNDRDSELDHQASANASPSRKGGTSSRQTDYSSASVTQTDREPRSDDAWGEHFERRHNVPDNSRPSRTDDFTPDPPEICPDLLRGGCAAGPSCSHSHSTYAFRSKSNTTSRSRSSPAPSTDHWPNASASYSTTREGFARRKKACRFFPEGRCTKGETCTFAHEGDASRSGSRSGSSPDNYVEFDLDTSRQRTTSPDFCPALLQSNCKDVWCTLKHVAESEPSLREHVSTEQAPGTDGSIDLTNDTTAGWPTEDAQEQVGNVQHELDLPLEGQTWADQVDEWGRTGDPDWSQRFSGTEPGKGQHSTKTSLNDQHRHSDGWNTEQPASSFQKWEHGGRNNGWGRDSRRDQPPHYAQHDKRNQHGRAGYDNNICRFFASGHCKMGTRCRWRHPEEHSSNSYAWGDDAISNGSVHSDHADTGLNKRKPSSSRSANGFTPLLDPPAQIENSNNRDSEWQTTDQAPAWGDPVPQSWDAPIPQASRDSVGQTGGGWDTRGVVDSGWGQVDDGHWDSQYVPASWNSEEQKNAQTSACDDVPLNETILAKDCGKSGPDSAAATVKSKARRHDAPGLSRSSQQDSSDWRSNVDHSGWDVSPDVRTACKEKALNETCDTALDLSHSPARQVCFDWQAGRCRFGSRCKYSHGDNEQSTRTEVSSGIDPATEPSKRREGPTCWKWLRGQCPEKYACRFVHWDLDYSHIPPGHAAFESKRPKAPSASGSALVLNAGEAGPNGQFKIKVLETAQVTFATGFTVKKVKISFGASSRVILQNVPDIVHFAQVSAALDAFGVVEGIRRLYDDSDSGLPGTMKLSVRFQSPSEAQQAIAAMDGALLFDRVLSASSPIPRPSRLRSGFMNDNSIRVAWKACGKVGYAGYATREAAEKVISRMNNRDMGKNRVTACMHSGLPSCGLFTVRFDGLHRKTKMADQALFGRPEGVMEERPNYDSLDSATKGIRKLLERSGCLVRFDVEEPPFIDGYVHGTAEFRSADAARAMSQALDDTRHVWLGTACLRANHMQYVPYTLPFFSYRLLEAELSTFQAKADVANCSRVTIKESEPGASPRTTEIKLLATDSKCLGQLKSDFDRLLRGDVARHQGKIIWHNFFASEAGYEYIQTVRQSHRQVHIGRNSHRRTINLFGPEKDRMTVSDVLFAKVRELGAGSSHVLHLTGSAIGVLMSPDLLALQEQYGAENIAFELAAKTLTVRGDEDAYEKVRLAVLRAGETYRQPDQSTGIECPICFNDVAEPMVLDCGHSWCTPCLSKFLTTATETRIFPLTCVGDEAKCGRPIPLEYAKDVLTPSQFDDVAHAAFMAHVYSHPKEFSFCPTPDCPEVYRTAPPNTMIQCPSCLVHICPSCNVEYHEGVKCEEREENQEQLFKEWTSTHDVKNCPGCKAPIERAAGCNHMTCSRCQTHTCWVCLETFPKGRGIYDHMRAEHGTIGL